MAVIKEAIADSTQSNLEYDGDTGILALSLGDSLPLGTANADRKTLVHAFYITDGEDPNLASAGLWETGNISATRTGRLSFDIGGSFLVLESYLAAVPTGTTNRFQLQFDSGGTDPAGLNFGGVYKLLGASLTGVVTNSNSSAVSGDTMSATLTVPSDGALMVFGAAYDTFGSFEWSGGGVTEDDDISGILPVSFASGTSTGSQTPLFTRASPVLPYRGILATAVAPGSGDVELTPNVLENTQTFFSGVVTTGAVGLTATLFTNTNTFFTAVVAVQGDLFPFVFTNTQTFFTPDVYSGNLAPTVFTNTQTFFSPVRTSTVALTGSVFTNSQTFFSGTITIANVLTPTLFTNTNTFPQATMGGDFGQAVRPHPRLLNVSYIFPPEVNREFFGSDGPPRFLKSAKRNTRPSSYVQALRRR